MQHSDQPCDLQIIIIFGSGVRRQLAHCNVAHVPLLFCSMDSRYITLLEKGPSLE